MLASFPTKPGQINLDKQVVGLLGAPRRIESNRESQWRPRSLETAKSVSVCVKLAKMERKQRMAYSRATVTRQRQLAKGS